MKPATLERRLVLHLGIITGVTCALLVLGTLFAAGVLIRRGQNERLSSLVVTMCTGIRNERAEHSEFDTGTAASHFFREAHVRGYRFEVWTTGGGLVTAHGDSIRLPRRPGDSSGCSSEPGESRNGDRLVIRSCRGLCEEHVVRVLAPDTLRTHGVRTSMATLLVALPIAVVGGMWTGRRTIRRLLRPLGQLRDAALHARAVPGVALGVAVETSELAELQAAFDALLHRTMDLAERERRFSGEAGHELRTPLTKLQLRLERLRDRYGERSAPGGEAAAALKQVERLARLVDALLLLARSESGNIPGDHVNLSDLARAVCSSEDNERVRAPDEVLIRGSEELLHRAIENVVENARKFAGDQPIRVSVSESAGIASLVVEDEGPGIPEEERERVTERFYRGPTLRTGTAGSGLGLAVVQAIVLRHGGQLDILSNDAGGATVRLTFPCSDVFPPAEPEA